MQIDDSNVSKIYFHQLGPSFLATALHVSTLGELGRAFSATGSQSNEPGTSPMKKGTRVEGGSWVRGGEPNPGGGGVRGARKEGVLGSRGSNRTGGGRKGERCPVGFTGFGG